jgi:hypothetical protein
MRVIRPIGQIAPRIAGGEVEVAPLIAGTVGLAGAPAASEIAACAVDRAQTLARPAAA